MGGTAKARGFKVEEAKRPMIKQKIRTLQGKKILQGDPCYRCRKGEVPTTQEKLGRGNREYSLSQGRLKVRTESFLLA